MVGTPRLETPIDTFLAEQDEVIRYWAAQFERSVDANDPIAAGLSGDDMRHASSLALVSCARNWEVFRSDWHTRAVAADATVLKSSLESRAMTQLEKFELGKALTEAGVTISISLAKHPSLPVIRTLLDRQDKNITFHDEADSNKRARRELAPHLAARAQRLGHDDWALINLVTDMRNAIAHGSESSITRMNESVKKMANTQDSTLHDLAWGRYSIRRSGIGAYLYSKMMTPGAYDNTRVIFLALRMKDLAEKFR